MNNNHYDGFDSRNSTIVFIDGPGDNTVRPCPPHLRPILEEIKRKEQEYKKLMQENAKPKELDENL